MNAPFALSLAVLAALTVLTVLGGRKKADRARYKKIERILGIAGAGLFALSVLTGTILVLASRDSPDAFGWAKDMTEGYFLLVGPIFALVFLPLLLRMLLFGKAEKRPGAGRTVRILLSLAGSAACLLLSAFFSSVTAGDKPELSPVFLFTGISLALILRLTLPCEYGG